MCGIVGLYARASANSNHHKLLRGMLFLDQIRGEHATGLAKVDLAKNEVSIMKKAVPAHTFLGMEDVQAFMDDNVRLWIGHNRWATMGAKDDDNNAHPFQADHITLVHNGTVNRWTIKDLCGNGEEGVVVDSHMVAKTIADLGAREAITTKLSGAFALVWYDSRERSLNFIRNRERPLWVASLTDGTLVWASEKEFIDFFITHSKFPLAYAKDGEPTLLPEEILYTWSFNQYGALIATKPSATVLKFRKSTDPNPPARSYKDLEDYYESLYPTSTVGNWTDRRRQVSGTVIRHESNDERINRILKQYGLFHLEADKEILFDVVRWDSFSKDQHSKGTLYGSYSQGTIGVRSFNVTRDMFNTGTLNRGVITNVYEEGMSDKKTLVIVVTLPASQKATEKKPDAVAEVAGAGAATAASNTAPANTVRFPQWPLKVHGYTFNSRMDFESVVRKGCTCCNAIPTHQNVWNPEIVVDPGRPGSRASDLEFLCGKCATGGDEESLNRILEKMNVK